MLRRVGALVALRNSIADSSDIAHDCEEFGIEHLLTALEILVVRAILRVENSSIDSGREKIESG